MNERLQNRCRLLELPLNPHNPFWAVSLQDISEDELKEAHCFLDQESQQRAKRFVFEEDRNRYLVSHAVLRIKIGELIHQKPSEILFSKNKYGKPYLERNPIYFNLSHTKTWAFFGIHRFSPIGVDIESCQKFACKTPNSKENQETLLKFWCAEEAYLKALGTGFGSKRAELNFLSSTENVDLFTNQDVPIHVYSQVIPGCLLAVCLLDLKLLPNFLPLP